VIDVDSDQVAIAVVIQNHASETSWLSTLGLCERSM